MTSAPSGKDSATKWGLGLVGAGLAALGGIAYYLMMEETTFAMIKPDAFGKF